MDSIMESSDQGVGVDKESKTMTTELLSSNTEFKSRDSIRIMGVDIEKPPSPEPGGQAPSAGSTSSESKQEVGSMDVPEASGQDRDLGIRKVRLTREQSNYLEENFREQTNPTSAEKERVAHKLGLQRRQVEVWFQNRRARSKLKRVQAECESLKKWCLALQQENAELKQKLQKALIEKALVHARQQLSFHSLFP